jgi:hypothetical protein
MTAMAVPTNSGILTDKEGTGFPGIRIDDKPFTVLNFVQRYLDAIPKKAKVCYQITDGKISKIWEDKGEPAQPAANGQSKPAQQPQQPGNNQSSCTSPDTPTLKTVEGQIITLDVPAHKVVLKTKDGQQHGFVWPPALNDQMSRLKQWYFARLTGEHQKDVDIWKLTAQEFFKRPEDWPATVHSRVFGGQPRNDKAIILQTCLKVAADVRIARGFCDSDDGVYADQMAEITAEAIKAADALCKAGGVQ